MISFCETYNILQCFQNGIARLLLHYIFSFYYKQKYYFNLFDYVLSAAQWNEVARPNTDCELKERISAMPLSWLQVIWQNMLVQIVGWTSVTAVPIVPGHLRTSRWNNVVFMYIAYHIKLIFVPLYEGTRGRKSKEFKNNVENWWVYVLLWYNLQWYNYF